MEAGVKSCLEWVLQPPSFLMEALLCSPLLARCWPQLWWSACARSIAAMPSRGVGVAIGVAGAETGAIEVETGVATAAGSEVVFPVEGSLAADSPGAVFRVVDFRVAIRATWSDVPTRTTTTSSSPRKCKTVGGG